MSLYQLDDNDISGTVLEWQKRHEEEEKKQKEKEDKERLKREEQEEKERKKQEKVTRENEKKERAARGRGKGQEAAKERERVEHQKKHKHLEKRTSRSGSNPPSDKRADNVPQKGKHRDSTRRESESGAHATGNDKTHKTEKENPDPRFRRHRTEEKAGTTKIDTAPQPDTSALKPEELEDKRPVKSPSEAYKKKISTPRSNSTAQASAGTETKTPSTQQKKSGSSDWGTWEVVSEDIEKTTRNKYELMQEYGNLGIANFRLERHHNLDIRMLAFGPGKKTFAGQRGKLILYTSKKGNGLFLIDKTDSSQRPLMPSIEPKVDCKTSVVFNKDRYDVEEARLDSRKLNNGEFPLACIEDKYRVPL
ncbi:hypothetical protein A7U60_g4318 [Sanghuangporus baumii]|uniref:Uncharacterized protein n=1 Tax=Sanghuangporus baumii TaxID=108892 RepID=A0A9Q5NCF2_SANBA|nr:hypothetical protein A7U60_g4318 [Sanghuangporus baumii]